MKNKDPVFRESGPQLEASTESATQRQPDNKNPKQKLDFVTAVIKFLAAILTTFKFVLLVLPTDFVEGVTVLTSSMSTITLF